MFNTDSIILKTQEIIKKAGDLTLSFYNKMHTFYYKSNGSYATQADLEVEEYLIKELKALPLDASFFAEESGIAGDKEYVWVIDPIDGTSNFAHGIPYFCINIALTYHHEPILAFTYQPLLKELFTAKKGCGAFLNDKKLSVSSTDNVQKAFFGTYLTFSDTFLYQKVGLLKAQNASIRGLGAGALDIAYCAAGKLDACFYEGTLWWDIAAGSLLLKEAGGMVSNLQGSEINAKNSSFLGGNKLMHQELVSFFKN